MTAPHPLYVTEGVQCFEVIDLEDELEGLLDLCKRLKAENAPRFHHAVDAVVRILHLCQAEEAGKLRHGFNISPSRMFTELMSAGREHQQPPALESLLATVMGDPDEVLTSALDVGEGEVLAFLVSLVQSVIDCWGVVRAFAETWRVFEHHDDSEQDDRRLEEIFAALGLAHSLGEGLQRAENDGSTRLVGETFLWVYCAAEVESETLWRRRRLPERSSFAESVEASESWDYQWASSVNLDNPTDDVGVISETMDELVKVGGIQTRNQDFSRELRHVIAYHKKAIAFSMIRARRVTLADGQSIGGRTMRRYESECGEIYDLDRVQEIFDEKQRNQRRQGGHECMVSQSGLVKAGLGSAASVRGWIDKALREGRICGERTPGRRFSLSEAEVLISMMSPKKRAEKSEVIEALLKRLRK